VWKIYHCIDINSFVTRFSMDIPSENELRNQIIDRFFDIKKRAAAGPLKALITRADWFKKIKSEETWIESQLTLFFSNAVCDLNSGTVEARLEALEILFARCLEVRLTTHHAVIFRDEPVEPIEASGTQFGKLDRESAARRRKFKDSLYEDNLEFHWQKGWLRRDSLSRIREVGLSTSASRLLADPIFYAQFKSFMSRTRLRRQPDFESKCNVSASSTKSDVLVGDKSYGVTKNMQYFSLDKSDEKAHENDETESEDASASSNSEHAEDIMKSEDDVDVEESAMQDVGLVDDADVDRMSEEAPELTENLVSAEANLSNVPNDDGIAAAEAGGNFEGDDQVDHENDNKMEVAEKDSNVEESEPPAPDTEISTESGPKDGVEMETVETDESSPKRAKFENELQSAEPASKSKALRPFPFRNTKCIEQLDLLTGKVLRRYNSGTDAAVAMQVSQSGISLCINGSKPDAYGFRWRVCDSFDEPYEETSIEDLLKMRHLKLSVRRQIAGESGYKPPKFYQLKTGVRQFEAFRPEIARTSAQIMSTLIQRSPIPTTTKVQSTVKPAHVVAKTSSSISLGTNITRPPAPIVLPSYEASREVRKIAVRMSEALLFELSKPIVRDAPWVELKVSSVSVNYRLLKLKAELFSVLAILPVGKMRWPNGEKTLKVEEALAAKPVVTFEVGCTVSTTYGVGVVQEIRADGMLVIKHRNGSLRMGSLRFSI
jgi:hypothetical protein